MGQWPREVRRYIERHDIPFPLLIDKHRQVIKSYGVYHWLGLDAYNIARPSTFIIDRGGIIRFIHVGSHQFDLPKHGQSHRLFGVLGMNGRELASDENGIKAYLALVDSILPTAGYLR